MNIVILKGNITRDLELAYTPKGTACVEIGVAVNKTWTTDSGEKKEKVLFADCRAWGKTAEALCKWFSKGKPIAIEGELALEEWTDKETGKKRRKTLVIINRWHFAGESRGRQAPEEPEDRGHHEREDTDPPPPAHEKPSAPIAEGMEDDDIPF